MVGSPVIAAFIAQAAFCMLLLYGLVLGEIDLKRLTLFLLLWLVARVGLGYVPYEQAYAMFSPFVAALDIALVFTIFRGDVRLT
jgi:hypothetical protein